MDAGQITQGLRTDSMMQNVNGSVAGQTTGSGASFADIMNVIIANVQNGQNEGDILAGQDMEILQNLLNTQDMSYLKNLLNMTDLFAVKNDASAILPNIQAPILDLENLFAASGEADIVDSESENNVIDSDVNDTMDNVAEITDENNAVEVKNENNIDIVDTKNENNVIEVEDKNDISVSKPENNDIKVKNEEVIVKPTDEKETFEVKNENNIVKPENNAETQNKVKPDSQDSPEIKTPVSEKKPNVENKEKPELTDKINADKPQTTDKPVATKNPYESFYNKDEQQVNVSKFNLYDIKIASGKLKDSRKNADKPNAYNKIDFNQSNADKNVVPAKAGNTAVANEGLHSYNAMTQKLTDIFGIITPELMNNDERDRKDSFDFSENVIKADPLQLAGLLDFISTGTGIPEATDISDSQLFKNISESGAMERISERSLFDPEDMIRSGEMEILSYKPAETMQKPVLPKPQNMLENDEKTIDFARTMKSVRENVMPVISDEDDEVKPEIVLMTAEDMNNTAEKIDISFDRAYAEYELNKAKYASADKQLFDGISKNLQKGRSEFTVKLKPEGLGEILVKLVSEDGGKAILSMVTSSAKTAQLLNRDLPMLQSSLNQHNVEIEDNSVKTLETVTASQQSAFTQYDERRQDEGAQQNQFRKIRKKLGNLSVGNVSYENESESISVSAVDSALNITI